MTEQYQNVLDQLAANDGAILYWQTDRRQFKPALDAGVIRQDGELLVHPRAVTVEWGMSYTMPERLIAERFAEVLRSWLTPEEHAEMVRLNHTPEYAGPVCASHNYCDANMAMMEAFESVTGRTMIGDEGEMSEADCKLWSDAWDYFRKNS